MQLTGSVTHPAVPYPAACVGTPLVTFLTLLVNVTNQRLEKEFRQRQRQAEQLTVTGDEEYDFVLVGGGSSGCVLAERLSQNPDVKVLLLERGGTEPFASRVPAFMTANIRANIAEYITGVPEAANCNGTGCQLTVPQVLGGGSTINAVMYVRGSSVDYDDWATMVGDPSWNYENVLPYFKRAEKNMDASIAADTKYHSTSGHLRVSWQPYRHPVIPLLAEAMEAAGEPFRLDINAEGQLGYSLIQTTTSGGERWSAYRGYLQPALGRPNLKVLTYATATRVVLEGPERRAAGVEYRDAAGKVRFARANREVILTAGAIGTPHLLMLSGIGPADELKAANIPVLVDLPVGEGLQDHPRVPGLEFECAPPLCEVDWKLRRRDLLQYAALRQGPLSETSLVQIGAFLRTGLDPPPPEGTGKPAKQPDVQVVFMGVDEDSNGTRCLANDPWRFNRVVYMPVLLHPRSRGSVRLNATNPSGPPVVRLGYFTDEGDRDIAVLVDSFKLGLRMEAPLQKLGLRLDRSTKYAPKCRALEFGSDEHLRCIARSTTATIWHWVSTCRMGRDDDDEAVVDARLRVKGVRGLRLADASVFPTLTSGNTNAPTIMVAERAADLLREAHGLA
ncbi:glucose dehydrogenase [FAD, quinone]-like [Thrips palmi]|uniref:Glucose dehydrogenase [FAD, quinone]-like n=1 Tax=Thrips palmi TaxID=161013 RepID=A0A6P8Z7B6_THRPL|nr:glucose dehydrogenase [FAD, quinone]-like [Thrips palmi]